MTLRRSFGQVNRRILHLYRQVAHGVTLGVRGMVIDGVGRVFLVKHSYIDGWYLPGGGVEVGETLPTALARELREEGNIELTDPPHFFTGRGAGLLRPDFRLGNDIGIEPAAGRPFANG